MWGGGSGRGECVWWREKLNGEGEERAGNTSLPLLPPFYQIWFFEGEGKRGHRHTHKKKLPQQSYCTLPTKFHQKILSSHGMYFIKLPVKICRFCRNSMFVMFSVPKISGRIRFCLLQPLQNGNRIEWKALVVISCWFSSFSSSFYVLLDSIPPPPLLFYPLLIQASQTTDLKEKRRMERGAGGG